MTGKPIDTLSGAIVAGLSCACPRCGKGKLFQGFITLKPRCEACGLDYGFADAGDGPAVFIIFFAGLIVVGVALIIEVLYQPPLWLHAVLWLPLILIVAWPVAADERIDDRAAISPQGRRRTLRRARALNARRHQQKNAGRGSVC